MKTSDNVDKILSALATVKANLSGVKKGTKNPFYKSNYADLNSHLDAVETLLEENGLVLFQPINNTEDGNIVSSRIYHVESGQFVESTMKLFGESDMQKAGSAVTYARRYTLGALLSMQAVDDDGNAASGKAVEHTQKTASESNTKPKSTETASQNRPSFRRPKQTTSMSVTTNEDDI